MDRGSSIATTRPRYSPGIESLLRSALEETCGCGTASSAFEAKSMPATAVPPTIFRHCLRVTDMMDDPPTAFTVAATGPARNTLRAFSAEGQKQYTRQPQVRQGSSRGFSSCAPCDKLTNLSAAGITSEVLIDEFALTSVL